MTDKKEIEDKTNQTSTISFSILFMLFLLVLNEISQNFCNKLKQRYPKIANFLQATSVTTLIGVVAGIFLKFSGFDNVLKDIKLGFSEFFLIILLPPILFESAINMEKRHFFKNFGSILMYAIFGTFIATFVTSLLIFGVGFLKLATPLTVVESLAFGSFISSTDPVAVLAIFKEMNADKTLYSLIYGESILNDAVSILLYDTFVKLKIGVNTEQNIYIYIIWNFFSIFLGSMAIGFLCGILSAWFLKYNESKNNDVIDDKEATILMIVPWVCYLLVEGINLSGIVSIMFCGITMARYALPNLSNTGRKTITRIYHTLVYNFENLVFLFIGIGFFGFEMAYSDMGPMLFIFAFVIIHLARYLNLGIITGILNFYRKKNKIGSNYVKMMWFAGFRGAMAYALSIKSAEIFVDRNVGNIMLTITQLYASYNIFVCGSLLIPLMERLEITEKQWGHTNDDAEGNEKAEDEPEDESNIFNRMKTLISVFDRRFMQKFLIKEQKLGTLDYTSNELCEKTNKYTGPAENELSEKQPRTDKLLILEEGKPNLEHPLNN